MKLVLKSHDTVQTIQEHFSSLFPFLRIEFYKHKHVRSDTHVAADQYLHNTVLHDITGTDQDIVLDFQPDMKTADLEHLFETHFKLHVELMRKQGGVWLQTTRSEDQTLEEQNAHGQEMDTFLHTKPELDEMN